MDILKQITKPITDELQKVQQELADIKANTSSSVRPQEIVAETFLFDNFEDIQRFNASLSTNQELKFKFVSFIYDIYDN